MAAETYTAQVIVLRKTKLGESDLILNLLAKDGSQLRVVAKGSRKPTNTFATRLELFCVAEILCSKGRSLDIVKEARLISAHENLRTNIHTAAAAAPMAELLDKVTERNLANPRLFELTQTAFKALCDASPHKAVSLTAAHLLKTLALVGLKPSFDACSLCGCDIDLDNADALVRLSYQEGGLLCENCMSTTKSLSAQSVLVPTQMCRWARVLLGSTFAQILDFDMDEKSALALLEFCQAWTQEHVGSSLKSLNFLFTSGLFT
ncbi:MAG: DNA repair protein RecO [Eggerthellaceae bacterium]|nr:DNA repair protein RecO [Eggerthellaceae bacterium]